MTRRSSGLRYEEDTGLWRHQSDDATLEKAERNVRLAVGRGRRGGSPSHVAPQVC
jgi:hypothetical protein